jgi:hypothetical protein
MVSAVSSFNRSEKFILSKRNFLYFFLQQQEKREKMLLKILCFVQSDIKKGG